MKIEFLSSERSFKVGIKKAIEYAISTLLENGITISDSGSQGGYLFTSRLFHLENLDGKMNPMFVDLTLCGIFPPEKTYRYMGLSMEKAYRLNKNNFMGGHVTSRQSVNEKEDEFSGAILVGIDISAFSGLFPKWDEFMSMINHLKRWAYRFLDNPDTDLIPDAIIREWNILKEEVLLYSQYTPKEKWVMDMIIKNIAMAGEF